MVCLALIFLLKRKKIGKITAATANLCLQSTNFASGTFDEQLNLDYPDLLLWAQVFMNINKSYFVSTAKLFSFKLYDKTWVQTESVLLQSINLNVFHAHMHQN